MSQYVSRSSGVAVRAVAFTVAAPTCRRTSGWAVRFRYQWGWSGAPW